MQRLLIVDDEWLIRKGIAGMVQRLSSEWLAEEASNGEEALIRIAGTSYDLVFCDIKMPGMDGIEMLEQLTRLGYRVPVVFLTGYDEFALVRNALRLRAYDYLLKPVCDEDMLLVLSGFKRDFLSISELSPAQHAKLKKAEFKLLNALDTFEPDRVALAIEEGRGLLQDSMTNKEYVDEVVRVTNQFFGKYRIYGFDKDLSMSSNELTNLANLQHTIRLRFAYLKEKEAADRNDKIIKLAKEYVNNNLHNQLTLAEVADYVHYNPTYFSEYFKENSGETFIQYVTRVKIEKAKVMLLDPTIKINDIADDLGYKDPRSFTKMFKMFLGMTPTEFRNIQF